MRQRVSESTLEINCGGGGMQMNEWFDGDRI